MRHLAKTTAAFVALVGLVVLILSTSGRSPGAAGGAMLVLLGGFLWSLGQGGAAGPPRVRRITWVLAIATVCGAAITIVETFYR